MYRSSILTALALTWTAGQAYRVDLYLGQECRSADAGEIKTSEARSCSNSPSQAQSAYISSNNDKDDELELLFKTGRTCTGRYHLRCYRTRLHHVRRYYEVDRG